MHAGLQPLALTRCAVATSVRVPSASTVALQRIQVYNLFIREPVESLCAQAHILSCSRAETNRHASRQRSEEAIANTYGIKDTAHMQVLESRVVLIWGLLPLFARICAFASTMHAVVG
jgi:hypothetical protein